MERLTSPTKFANALNYGRRLRLNHVKRGKFERKSDFEPAFAQRGDRTAAQRLPENRDFARRLRLRARRNRTDARLRRRNFQIAAFQSAKKIAQASLKRNERSKSSKGNLKLPVNFSRVGGVNMN